MTVTFAGVDMNITIHKSPVVGQWDAAVSRFSFFGVRGELTHTSPPTGRMIMLDAHLTGFASEFALLTAMNNLQLLRGNPIGTLVINSTSFDYTTFESVEATEAPWLDASGVNGWQCDIKLTWRQSNNGNEN